MCEVLQQLVWSALVLQVRVTQGIARNRRRGDIWRFHFVSLLVGAFELILRRPGNCPGISSTCQAIAWDT